MEKTNTQVAREVIIRFGVENSANAGQVEQMKGHLRHHGLTVIDEPGTGSDRALNLHVKAWCDFSVLINTLATVHDILDIFFALQDFLRVDKKEAVIAPTIHTQIQADKVLILNFDAKTDRKELTEMIAELLRSNSDDNK